MSSRMKKSSGRSEPWVKTIYGEPASKANSRKIVKVRGRIASIKSDKARAYLEAFAYQCPTLDPPFTGDVQVELKIWYASRRPDLDESVILDALQGRVYINDRQVRRKIVEWGLDPERPRAELRICLLQAGAIDQ